MGSAESDAADGSAGPDAADRSAGSDGADALVGSERPGGAAGSDGWEVPLLAGRGLVGGAPAAYVCRNFTCRAPVTDPDLLRAELTR